MKNAYQIFYIISGLLFVIVLLGGSLTKSAFNNFSEKSLNAIGITKSSIDSIDGSIDEVLFKVNRVSFQIEKLKNLLSDEKPIESISEKKRNEVIYRNVYKPINEILITIYRLIFLLISIIIFFSAVIFHLINKGIALKGRINIMELRLNRLELKIS